MKIIQFKVMKLTDVDTNNLPPKEVDEFATLKSLMKAWDEKGKKLKQKSQVK